MLPTTIEATRRGTDFEQVLGAEQMLARLRWTRILGSS